MAYSSGFSPHPRISYADAAPTGAASEAEFAEIGLSATCDPERVRVALDAALPPGLDVVRVVPAGVGALADRLTGSRWRIALTGVPAETLERAVAALLAATEVTVERMTKNGIRSFDARGAVVSLRPVETTDLELVSRHLVPLVRPDDVLAALAAVATEFRPTAAPVLTRVAQGQLSDDGEIADPL